MFKLNDGIEPGNGVIELISQTFIENGKENERKSKRIHTNFKILKYSYPLKLIPIKSYINHFEETDLLIKREIQTIYMLSYGGGLVLGDLIKLKIELGEESCLVLLTQGSTKVFKQIHHQQDTLTNTIKDPNHQSIIPFKSIKSKQIITVNLKPHSIFISLPSPITTYKSSNFSQTQTFKLSSTNCSLLVLDWLTTGRKHFKKPTKTKRKREEGEKGEKVKEEEKGEEWEFEQYKSINSFYLQDKLILKDSLTLNPSQQISLKTNDQRFSIFVTIYLISSFLSTDQTLHSLHHHFESLQTKSKPNQIPKNNHKSFTIQHSNLIWSYNHIKLDSLELNHQIKIGLIKCIGNDLIEIHQWISKNLSSIQTLIGLDLYQNAFQ